MSYIVNESVIVIEDGKYYLAKILAVDNAGDQHSPRYYIHYNGWGSKYDQWVTVENIYKDNEVNRALMKYKNRVEEGAYQNTSIQDEIVVKYFTKAYETQNKSRIPFQLHKHLILDWYVRIRELVYNRW
ncbi:histone H4 acetyltransferase [Blastocystis sp. subtype 4]|uniref:histone H4 acetyltransferase n=1 Tax=Blastocystis sp. subtype 4 TaxID=944170 RepID=UPI000711EF57|nr:histone H4 acetyltransferase [Blastocystis sp. subtype 4]KNB46260.1 histone H4 acetyltransferase [Blastocystis sp. subtype 4]|eukprot:XP_014529702.1 histone H4 acetyltransferase [Blastocystis sp. subtype 4]